MRILLYSLVIITALSPSTFALPKCHTNELWQCVEILIDWIHSLPKRSLPVTQEDTDNMCQEVNSAFDCALRYREACVTPLQKEVLDLTIEGFLALRKEFCVSGSEVQKRYLNHATCLNKISQSDEVHETAEYVIAVVNRIHDMELKDMINYICCGYTKVFNKFMKLGIDNCGEEATQAARSLLNIAVAQLPDVVCNGFEGREDQCAAILPPDGTKMEGEPKGDAFNTLIRDVLRNWLE